MTDRCSPSLIAGSTKSNIEQCARETRSQLLAFAFKPLANSPKTGAANNIGNTCGGMARNLELLPIYTAHKNTSSASQTIAMTTDKGSSLFIGETRTCMSSTLHYMRRYRVVKHSKCPIAAKLHDPIGRLQIRKVQWEPSWEPSDVGIPQDMIDALDEAKNATS